MKVAHARQTLTFLGLLAALAACSETETPTLPGDGSAKLVLLNALAAGPAPTLRVDGQVVALPGAGLSATWGFDAGAHQLQLFNGTQLLASATLSMSANSHRTAVVSGTMSAALLVVNTLDSAVVPLTDAAKIRLVHTAPDAQSTDAYLLLTTQVADSSTRFVFPFTYGTGSDVNFPGYGVRPPGQYLVVLKVSGTNTTLLQAGPFSVSAGGVYSLVLARNEAGALEIRSVKEN